MALMAFLDSEVYNDKTCSKTCVKNYETLKKQCDDLIIKLNQTEFTVATYKRGLATVEEQLITYRKNEVLFSEEVVVLKREVACKDYEINVLKSEFEKVKQEKEGIEFKIEKFDNASKSLNKLLESQITDKSKKGLGYNVVPPPHPLIYNRPKRLDLSYSSLDEFKDPEFKSNGSEDSKQESNILCDKKSDASKENFDDSLVKEQVSEDTSSFVESSLNVDKETIFLVDKKIEFVKPKNHKKPVKKSVRGKPQQDDTGFIDNGCLRHMTGNIAYLSDFKEFNGGYVTFGGGAHGGRISSKGILKSDSLDFKDVYFVNELNFNIFSVSQMCDKKNYVLFTDIECLVLSPNFKLPDESQILIKIPRKDNMYSLDMKNIVPKESLSCLVAKTTSDESMLWHRRLGHINFKNINKLVKDNLVRGLPTKHFENDQTCVACLKGKQHRAFYKSKVLNLTTKPLFMLHMDLFGPTFMSSLMHKKYFLVVTDDYRRFTWVFFLTTKDETSEILMNFIKEIENLVDNQDSSTKCVAERRNRTLIEAARTMLADSKLPTTFWAEAVSTACYVQNRVLVVKPHNKTPYELFNSKAFRVYNTRTRRVEENLHIRFLENKPMIEGNGLKWLFDIDSLTQSMNYVPVVAGTITNESADASYFDSPSKDVGNGEPKSAADDQKQVEDGPDNENDEKDKSEDDSSPKEVNAAGQHFNIASPEVNTGRFKLNTIDPSVNTASSYELDSPKDKFKLRASHTLKTTHVEFFSDEDEREVDLRNITNSYTVPTTPNTRIHKDHPIKNVIGDVKSTIQTRRMTKSLTFEQGLNPQALLKPYLINLGWKQCMKNFQQFSSNRNKARLVAQGHRQEEGIDYEEVFAPMARIRAIRLLLAYASFMGFLVYQIDVKSAFLYGTIEEEVYVTQPPGFKDHDHPEKFTKGGPRHLYLFASSSKSMVTQKEDGIFISQDKYVAEILKKFNYTDVKSASTLVDLEKPLVKDRDADDVDVHLYRSMIGSLMYLIASRPDIMFAVCACARFQVTPKTSHLLAIKRIFRYLKGKPTLGLWYSRDSPFELVAYTDSDYARATQDRKSTTRGCQFLGNRLISWQCKKQTVVATSTTKAEYVAAASCCGQVLWIQNQLLDYWHVKRVRETKIPQSSGPLVKVGDEAVHKELGDRMERVATTAPSLEAEQTSATARTTDAREVEITASIDGQVKTITEASLRRHLKLEDSNGITYLPNTEIFKQLALMGYVSDSARLTFQKGHLSPQWRVSKGYSGIDFPLFPTIITAPESSPSRITSSPSLSPQTHQSHQSSPLRDISRQAAEIPQSQFPTQTQVADEATFISVDDDVGGAATTDIGLEAGQGSCTMHKTPTRAHEFTLHSEYSALTKLILRVKKLEKKVKTNKAKRRVRIVISEDEDAEEDSSKQGRKISEIDKDPTILLVQHEQDMEYDFDVSTAKGFTTASVPVTTDEIKISTANISVSTTPESDPAVLRYHAVQNRSFSKAEVRKNMCQDVVEEHAKRQRTEEALGPVQEQTGEEPKVEGLSQEQLHQMIMVIPVEEVYVEALQVKYPIIDWEIYSEDKKKY
ncbi:putative ribonuclease H-like domain-containing protein [Tanacetum coccineum]